MPAIVRKLTIYASIDGLILQPHGGCDPLEVKFESRSIGSYAKVGSESFKQGQHLESHGLIGLLTIASDTFLLCITRKEQVAQILGRPIYVIKDVAILPLSCQAEAERAIKQAGAGLQKAKTSQEPEVVSSLSEESGSDSFEENSVADPELQTPPDGRGEGSTSVVQNVFERKGEYGRFTSQWFSRRGWALDNKGMRTGTTPQTVREDQTPQPGTAGLNSENDSLPPISSMLHQYNGGGEAVSTQTSTHDAAAEMVPKILRRTVLLLTSRSFYFSYEFNITKRFGSSTTAALKSVSPGDLEQQYYWNGMLAMPFSEAGFSSAIVPIMQGYVGQQVFVVKDNSEDNTHTEAFKSLERVLKADGAQLRPNQLGNGPNPPQSLLLTLVSRRSVKRSGLRYLRRGIDDEGNCANSVETEQILSSPTWEDTAKIRSFVQIRCSIPLYFSQSPYAFKPVPILHHSHETNRKAFLRHFEVLRQRYGAVHIVSLIDKHGVEGRLGKEYENFANSRSLMGEVHEHGFDWFDFHTECRGMKFENVQKLVHAMEGTLNSFGETVIHGQTTKQRQTGVVRTNCMDCLDRTNVVQSAFAQYMLQKDLEREDRKLDFVHDPSTQWFNTLWADNGDAISRQYASTAALKGDYTRTRKRDYRGALNDFRLTLTRYYNNIVNDYFSQTVIDVLLGNVTSRVFDDFVATMMSADPGISIDKVREDAIDTCSTIVIQHPEEDLIHGWAMLAPAQTNTLRTLPFEEAILLLTDHAIYGCKFDWSTEKVASFERIDLRSITNIRYGTYITSTLTEGQMDEDLNVGLVISYVPGKENIKRVNTRSLQVSVDVRTKDESEDSRGPALLSWLRSRNPDTSQCMAMKIIADRSLANKVETCPVATAENICNEIQRAITDGISRGGDHGKGLVEKADIISRAEARSRTGYLEQLGHSIKKLVWT